MSFADSDGDDLVSQSVVPLLTKPQGVTAECEQDVDHSLKFLTSVCSHGDHVHLSAV